MLGIVASSASGSGGPPPPPTPIDPATLFGVGVKGGYWDFTNLSTLAINADGTGGSPALDGTFRYANDLGPNGVDLRNTVNDVTARDTGFETPAGNYGLFNLAGFGAVYGDWASIDGPCTIIAIANILTFASGGRLIASYSNPLGVLQGIEAGVLLFDSVATDDQPCPLNEFHTWVATFDGGGADSLAVDGGVASGLAGSGQNWDSLLVSSSGGGGASHTIFKNLLFIGRALTSRELAGAIEWMEA